MPKNFAIPSPSSVIVRWGCLLLVATLCAVSARGQKSDPKTHKPDLSKLGLSFVQNSGQAPPQVSFQVNTMGGVLSFVDGAVLLDLPVSTVDELREKSGPVDVDVDSAKIQIRYENAQKAVRIRPGKKMPGVVNYLIGDDRDLWLTNIPTYANIVYEGLYAGVDLVYEGSEGRLKGTFHVAPGIDPYQIKWSYQGGGVPQIDVSGNLIIPVVIQDGAKTGFVTEMAPIAWQVVEGVQKNVDVKFRVDDRGEVSFDIGTYDPTLPLVLDPVLAYSTLIGGNGTDHVVGLKIDDAGFVYVTGRTHSNAANPGPGWPLASAIMGYGGEIADAYISKLDFTGQFLVYSTYIGGGDPVNFFIIGGADWGLDIDIDSLGRPHICGLTESTNFPTTPNALSPNKVGGITDAFYTVLNAAGNAIEYSTYLGGTGSDQAWGLKIAADGSAHIAGYTGSGDYPVTPNAFQTTFSDLLDGFVTKIDPNGAMAYSTYFGFDGFELVYDVDVDSTNHIYLAGRITSTVNALLLNPPGVAPLQPLNAGESDGFLVKFAPQGNGLSDLRYFTYWGGHSEDYSFGLEVDANNFVYMAGITGSFDFPVLHTQLSFGGEADAFAMKQRTNGTGMSDLVYSVTLGGQFFDQAFDVAVLNGYAYIGGLFTTFGGVDAFWVKLHDVFGFVLDFDLFGHTQFFDMILGIDINQFSLLSCGGYTACENGTTANLNCPTDFPLQFAMQPVYGGGSGDGFIRTYFVP